MGEVTWGFVEYTFYSWADDNARNLDFVVIGRQVKVVLRCFLVLFY